jgi:hypothetical protein
VAFFKYAPPERVNLLEVLKIRFTPGDEFNDPFEITPSARFMENPEYFDRFVTRCANQQASREVADSKILREEREERITELRAKLGSDFKGNLIGIKGVALSAMRTRFGDYRILCLSRVHPEDPAGLLLWAHYTVGHTGLVFEFNEGHEWIRAHDSRSHDLRDMGEVEYRTERPLLEGSAVRRNCYLAKSKHWDYENEYRLVRSSSDQELDSHSLASIPSSLIISVTLGADMAPEVYEKLMRILNGNPALAHVKVYQGELHVDEYKVTRSLLHP